MTETGNVTITSPFCERCGAIVPDPCTTDKQQAGCELPAFCFGPESDITWLKILNDYHGHHPLSATVLAAPQNTAMSELIERVARALAEVADFTPDDHWPLFESKARAAIEAMREPTEAMVSAAWDGTDPMPDGEDLYRVAWGAMIDAALSRS